MDRAARTTVELRGACGAEDWSLFTTERPEYQDKAKATCANCPVRNECLIEYFFEAGVVVGGTTWKERQAMLRNDTLPVSSKVRLVESLQKGGIRALMLEANLSEDEAVKFAKTHTSPTKGT